MPDYEIRPRIEPARFALPKDLQGSLVAPGSSELSGRLVIGSYGKGGSLFVADRNESVLGVGDIGTGKTESLLGPGLMLWDGPAIATSSKPDLVLRTAGYRIARGGPVFVFDPSGRLQESGERLPYGKWNLLANCKTSDGAKSMAEVMFKTAKIATDKSEDKAYWSGRSKKYIAGLLLASALMTPEELEDLDQTPMEFLLEQVLSGNITLSQEKLEEHSAKLRGRVKVLHALLTGTTPDQLHRHLEAETENQTLRLQNSRYGFATIAEEFRENKTNPRYNEARAEWIAGLHQGEISDAEESLRIADGGLEQLYELDGTEEKEELARQALVYREEAGAVKRQALVLEQISQSEDQRIRTLNQMVSDVFEPWDNKAVLRSTNGHDFDPTMIIANKGTVFTYVAERDQESLGPIEDLLLSITLNAGQDYADMNPKAVPLLAVVDEMGTRRIPGLPQKMALARDRIVFLSAVQNVEQPVQFYGETGARTVIQSHPVRVHFGASTHWPSLEGMSLLMGDEVVDRHSTTTGETESITTTPEDRPLLPAAHIRRLRRFTALVLRRDGHPAYVHMDVGRRADVLATLPQR